jgi:phosphoesterase RecJ-like protein
VSESLFHTNRPEKIKLLGRVLSSLRMEAGGTIALISMFRRDLADLRLAEIDTEDITTLARSIAGVSVVLFFKEIEPDVFRVSIRSMGTPRRPGGGALRGGGHATPRASRSRPSRSARGRGPGDRLPSLFAAAATP